MNKTSEEYGSVQEYLEALEKRAKLPEGFKTSTVALSLVS